MLDLNLNQMFVINVMMFWWLQVGLKRFGFRCILLSISGDEAVNRLNNYVLEGRGVL